ncbi:endonuclease domain-containing protein [Hyphomonas sp.]|jgi:very-short-patch-repair endonuclease|uniref:endonuclease domain-containing protein n=1 Tax=Hyphomonas sp. TaxID=87 RepID=UPI0032D8DE86
MRDDEKPTVKHARRLRRTMTRAEVILWQHIRKRQLADYRFRRQVPIGPYIADFACAELRLVVEVDGDTHSEPDEIAHDARRTAFLGEKGWQVHRVWNNDIYENLEGVLEGLLYQLRQASRDG